MTIRVLSSNDGQVLANTITDADIEISNVAYRGADVASGTFTNGQAAGIGIDEGIILTTGNVNNAIGNNFFASTFNGGTDDPALGALIGNRNTNDAASLEFNFESEGENASFDLVFATDEFLETFSFNDVFGLFLNGENIAFVPGTDTPISANSINDVSGFANSNFNFNDFGYDSFTNVFTVELTDLEPGTNNLRFAIADTGDSIVDSAIFIAGDVTVENQAVNTVSSPIDGEFVGTDGNDGITGDGLDNAILGRSGNDALDGGAGNDILDGGEGSDTAVYQFNSTGVTANLAEGTAIDADGSSTDTLISIENIIASELEDNLVGDDGVNSLAGRGGNDVIDGGAGEDFIIGGDGADSLTGGEGSDRFVYFSPSEGGDTISDFEVGADEISPVSAAFGGGLQAGALPENRFTLDTAATNSEQRFIFDDATGDLFFDVDGNGIQDRQLIANVGTGTGLSSSDIQLL